MIIFKGDCWTGTQACIVDQRFLSEINVKVDALVQNYKATRPLSNKTLIIAIKPFSDDKIDEVTYKKLHKTDVTLNQNA